MEKNFTRELTLNITSTALSALGKQRHVFTPVLNIVLSITATLGNVLILVALRKVSSLHPPTKLLFRCLAFTDLCVGLISQPLYAVAVMPRSTKMNRDLLSYFILGNYVSSYILCGVSALTSTAVSRFSSLVFKTAEKCDALLSVYCVDDTSLKFRLTLDTQACLLSHARI